LDDIEILKERSSSGQRLEINQMEKIKNEEKIKIELEKLKLEKQGRGGQEVEDVKEKEKN